MLASFTLSDDGTYLIERTFGQHTVAIERIVMNELFSRMQATGVRHVLVDAREQHTQLQTMEIYMLWAEMVPRTPHAAKFAVVVGWPITGRPFIEDVAVNRGILIRYFNVYDDALAWLRGGVSVAGGETVQ